LIARFHLVGTDQAGIDTDQAREFSLSGDAPLVQEARANVPASARENTAEALALKLAEDRIKAALLELDTIKANLSVQAREMKERADAQMRTAHDNQVGFITAVADAERRRAEAREKQDAAEHQRRLDDERQRRADERADREAERKEEADLGAMADAADIEW
jgi:hypothetical protein